MDDYFKQSVREADIHFIVNEITAFADCIETRQMLIGALQLSASIGVDLEGKYRLDGCKSYGYFMGVISKWINLKGNEANTVELDKALRSIGWNAAADNVKDKWFSTNRAAAEANMQDLSKSGQLNKPIWFNMRDPISSFTGREDTLEQVYNIFFSANAGQQDMSHCKIKSTQVAVLGLGGVGKSEFARKFATVYYTEFDRNVAWINAESAHLLQESFKELAAEIGIGTTNVSGKKDFLKMIKSVYEHFSESNSLFIFDNVEAWFDGEDGIKEYLPKGLKPNSKTPYILMTSRNRPKVSKTVAIVNLSVLTEMEAVQLIQYRLDTENSKIYLQLAKLLGCLPLALQQAISYIQQEVEEDIFGMESQEVIVAKCIQSYIEIFDTEAKKLLDYKDDDFECDFEELKTTWVTWRITLEKIQVINPNTIPLLTMMSYISPDSIYWDMFEPQFSTKGLIAAVNALLRYSMITKHSVQSNVISVHRLVQLVVRLENEEKPESTLGNEENRIEDEENVALVSVLFLLNVILEELPDSITPYTTACVIHAQVAWQYALAYPELLKQFENYPIDLYSKLTLHEMHESYLSLLQQTLSMYKLYDFYKESDEHYILVQQFIGSALLDLGRYEDAKSLLNLTHKIAVDALGDFHPLTLDILSNLTIVESAFGNCSDQMTLLEKITGNERTANFGPYHKGTFISRYTKAASLANMGKHNEALDLFKSTLELMEKYHPEDRYLISVTRYQIAFTTQLQGNSAEALQMFKNLHAELVARLGVSHKDTLGCAHGIGGCLLGLGRLEDAMEILKYNMKLANEHPSSRVECIDMKELIGKVLFKMARYDEAINQFRIVLDEQASMFGEKHQRVLTTRDELAYALEITGCTDEALQHYIFVHETYFCALGPEHPHTIRVKKSIESILDRQS